MSNWRDKYKKNSGDFAPGWKPEEGDECEGVVTGTDEIKGEYGTYTCYTIACSEDGAFTGERLAIHANRSILAKDLEDAGVGDLVAVTYQGKETSKKGNTYHAYDVAVMPADEVAEAFPDLASPPETFKDEESF